LPAVSDARKQALRDALAARKISEAEYDQPDVEIRTQNV
jgi:hypothetical protein